MAKNNRSAKKKNNGDTQSSTAMQKSGSRTEMASRTGSPFAFMRRFSEEMDRLFEDFGFGRGWLAPGFEHGLDRLETLAGGAWAPQVEVIEHDNQLLVRADLPGLRKDDVSVEIGDQSLIIRGERKTEHEEDEEGYYRTERSYGSFYRQIPLPSGVKVEEAKADFRNGVLEITMPTSRRAEARRRQLEITSEGKSEARAKAAGQK